MSAVEDELFLLEALVENVVLNQRPLLDGKVRTCVCVECLHTEPMEICDDEKINSPNGPPCVYKFNCGKSSLFSMKPGDVKRASERFPIKVTVASSQQCSCLPTRIVAGIALIDMTKEFAQAYKTFAHNPTVVSYQAVKDSFRLMKGNTAMGTINLFLRISCFGHQITTRFTGTPGRSSYLGAPPFNPAADPVQAQNTPCSCGALRGIPGFQGENAPACPLRKDNYNTMPCVNDDICYCTGPKPEPVDKMKCRNTDQYCLHIPKGRSKLYEEVGSNINGNELRLKVPAVSAVIKKVSLTHCQIQSPFVPKGKPVGNCDLPCAKNQISLALPTEAICCSGPRPQGTSFTCTTESCLQAAKHANALTKEPPKEPSIVDSFLLKVAKTALAGDRRIKLEMEVVAPKAGNKKPPIGKRDARIQSDLQCECAVRRIKKPIKKKMLY